MTSEKLEGEDESIQHVSVRLTVAGSNQRSKGKKKEHLRSSCHLHGKYKGSGQIRLTCEYWPMACQWSPDHHSSKEMVEEYENKHHTINKARIGEQKMAAKFAQDVAATRHKIDSELP